MSHIETFLAIVYCPKYAVHTIYRYNRAYFDIYIYNALPIYKYQSKPYYISKLYVQHISGNGDFCQQHYVLSSCHL